MAVSRKGLRTVKFKGQEYLWHVTEEKKPLLPEEGFVVEPTTAERLLHIISSNKKFIVHYRLPATADSSTLLRIEGPFFPRAPHAKEIHVPRWRHDANRYPTADFVRRLIQWCMEEEERKE